MDHDLTTSNAGEHDLIDAIRTLEKELTRAVVATHRLRTAVEIGGDSHEAARLFARVEQLHRDIRSSASLIMTDARRAVSQ